MNEQEKREKLLKLEYESTKSWTFSILAIIIALALGLANPNLSGNYRVIFATIVLICIVGLIMIEIIMFYYYFKLRKLYKPKEVKRMGIVVERETWLIVTGAFVGSMFGYMVNWATTEPKWWKFVVWGVFFLLMFLIVDHWVKKGKHTKAD